MQHRLTREEFISRSIAMHGILYDYSKVNYKNTKTKVYIICHEHGIFYQFPYEHMRGSGCRLCYDKSHTLTQEQFISKASSTHKGKYDYSKVAYTISDAKICIVCPIHGMFWQKATGHLYGQGCPKCATEKRSEIIKYTTEEFIKEAISIHGTFYGYSEVNYVNNKMKVNIICPVHGGFWITPSMHLYGKGCLSCKMEKRVAHRAMNFLSKAISRYGEKFDYSEVLYKGHNNKVRIICRKHGAFYIIPNYHLRGLGGCPHCKCSKGEEAIRKWLVENRIKFTPYYSYSDLKGPGRGHLKFDFYLQKYNSCVEYDGEQHFRPVKFKGISDAEAIRVFKKGQYYDSLKNQYCEKNSISLLRIPYTKFKEIPGILTENILNGGLYACNLLKMKE